MALVQVPFLVYRLTSISSTQELATQLQLQEVKYEGIVDGLKTQVNDTRKTLEGKIDVLAKEVGSELQPID